MEDERNVRRVTPYRLTVNVAEQRIKLLASSTGNIQWSDHALERMVEREIFDVDALRVLRNGNCEGEPERTQRDEWKCKMVRRVRGTREVGVVVIITNTNRLFVKTIEWEDLT